jgi:hypothetical protein
LAWRSTAQSGSRNIPLGIARRCEGEFWDIVATVAAGCQRPQRVVAALYPDRSLSFTMMLDMLPDGYDQHHEHDL